MIDGKLCFVCGQQAEIEKTNLNIGLCNECDPYFTESGIERVNKSPVWLTHERAEIALARLQKTISALDESLAKLEIIDRVLNNRMPLP